MSPPLDAYLKALAALVSASFALLILTSAPKQLRHQLLAVFLFLIAGNQAAEAVRAVATTAQDQLYWFRFATVFAAFDPLVLLWFASVSPGGERLHKPAFLLPTLFVSAAFAAVGATLATLPPVQGVFPVLLLLFTLLVYGGVALTLGPAAVARQYGASGALTFAALGIAAIPVVSNFAEVFVGRAYLLPRGQHGPDEAAIQAAASIIAGFVSLVVYAKMGRRAGVGQVGTPRRITLAILTIVLASIAPLVAPIVTALTRSGEAGEAVVSVGRAAAPVRWLLFGSLMSVVLLRYDALAMGLGARRRAARLLITLGILTLAAMVVTASQFFVAFTIPLQPLEGALLVGAILLSQGFRGVVDRVAERVYGVPLRGDHLARHAAYRAAAAQVAAEGRHPTTDAALARLRDELEIDAPTAALLVRMADESSGELLQPGRSVAGRYRVHAALGRGGSGRAFLARDLTLERDVVLKEVPIGGEDADVRSLQEARTAGAIQHPNVMVVHDVLLRVGSTILVTEHVGGGSLEARLGARGPLPHAEAWPILEGILAGVAAVHAHGIVHGDIKPGNVLLTPTGAPKVADFGVARLAPASTVDLRATNSFVGTPAYMAPEQRRGGPATPASDVYALGVLARSLFAQPLPPEVDAIVRIACAEEPSARYRDASEMLEALGRGRAAAYAQ